MQKYNCTNGGARFCDGCYQMSEDTDGLWYRVSDVAAHVDELNAELEASRLREVRLQEMVSVAESDRDKFKAVLSGAQYQNLDGFTKMPVADCKSVGAEVAALTIAMQKERDTLRDVLALLAPDLKAMAILYAQQGDHTRSQALANICKSVGVL